MRFIVGLACLILLPAAAREFRDVRAAGVRATTDIGQRGWMYSSLFIGAATLAIHGAVLRTLPLGYRGIAVWAHHIWTGELQFAQEVVGLLRRL